jgi:hypothetical protein
MTLIQHTSRHAHLDWQRADPSHRVFAVLIVIEAALSLSACRGGISAVEPPLDVRKFLDLETGEGLTRNWCSCECIGCSLGSRHLDRGP